MRFKIVALIFFQVETILCQFDYSKCGKNNAFDGNHVAGATNNLEKNPLGNWPWMASLGYYDADKKWTHKCGATLITERHFLTAAHCADIIKPEWLIRIGDTDHASKVDDRYAQDISIINTFIHPRFDGISSYFDIAILKTDDVEFSKLISPICLPNEIYDGINKYDNDLVELVGWGSATATGDVSERLKRVSVQVFSQKTCNSTHMPSSLRSQAIINEKLPDLFRADILCAGTNIGGQSSCKGDSGGPLMFYVHETNSWVQLATVQGSVGDCGSTEYPGIYIRLDHSSVLSFIASTIGKAADFNFQLTQYFHAGTSVENVDCRDNLRWCKKKCENFESGTLLQIITKGTETTNYVCRQV